MISVKKSALLCKLRAHRSSAGANRASFRAQIAAASWRLTGVQSAPGQQPPHRTAV